MRIGFAFEGTVPSLQADTEVFVHTAAAMGRRGHEVTLWFACQSGDCADAEIIASHYGIENTIRFLPQHNPFGQRTMQHGLQAIRVPFSAPYRECDVLYTRHIAIAAAALRGSTPVLFDHYRPLPDQVPLLQPLLRSWMAHSQFLGMACHSDVAMQSYARIGIAPDRLRVIHNGFDPNRIRPVLSKSEARRAVGLEADRPTVVYSGRINEKKGLDVVFALAAALPDVHFVLVGASGDGNPVETEAEKIDNVTLVPWQMSAATAPYLYAADVLIIPPSSAPLEEHGRTVLPLKVYLYLGIGRPILAGDTVDIREVLHHRENAWLVPPGDLGQAADAIATLCGDTDLAAKLSQAALADAANLTWDARAERLEAFIEERLEAPRVRDVGSDWSIARWARECVR